jgi:hypothetical protein
MEGHGSSRSLTDRPHNFTATTGGHVYDLGDVVVLSVNTYDATGALANATNVALVVTPPTLTAQVIDPVAPTSTGAYVYPFPTGDKEFGQYKVRWVATGANASAYPTTFHVVDFSCALVSLERAHDHENFLNNVDDEELRSHIVAASVWAEREYGPLGRQEFTEHRTPCGNQVPLSHWAPGMVITPTSVVGAWGNTATYDVATLHVTDAGILEPNLGGTLGYYPLEIKYQAGYAVITEDVQIGVLEVIAGLWETQHGGGTSGGGPEALLQASGEGEFVANMGLRYWRADMLLKSHKAPVVA